MPERWNVSNPDQLKRLNEHLAAKLDEGKSTLLEFVDNERNSDQNSLFHAILREVAKQKGDESVNDIKRYVKLTMGVPILRASDAKFRELYDDTIKGSLSYEQKLEAMDILPVTSRMGKKDFATLIDDVIQHYTQQGYRIKITNI